MTEPTSILLFGDQTGDYRKTFRRVLQIKENPLLTAFLDRSYSVLRQEVANQPRLVRERTTGFTSIADLVARYAHSEKPRCNAFESALTYISQIACFFATYGDKLDEYPSKSDTHVVGSCTGLLAAAVVSSSQNLVDLLPAAVEVVKVAYRVGSLVSEVGEQVEQLSTHSPSWSVVLPGLLEEELANNLKVFHEQKVCIINKNKCDISDRVSASRSRINCISVQSGRPFRSILPLDVLPKSITYEDRELHQSALRPFSTRQRTR